MSSKPPILFLHGAFAGPAAWEKFIAPWFASRGHRVSVPELPGTTSGPARLRDYVLRAQEAAEDLGDKPIVVGHSLGGLVAQHLAARQCASGAVLVSSPGPCGLAPSLWQLSSLSPEVLAMTLAVQVGAADLLTVDLIREALFTPETPDEWILDVMPAIRPESPQALFDALAWDFPAWPFARLTPTLAILGDRDAFIPVTDLWSLGMAYGAEIVSISGAGHGLPMDINWKSLAWRINAWIDERRIAERRDRMLALTV